MKVNFVKEVYEIDYKLYANKYYGHNFVNYDTHISEQDGKLIRYDILFTRELDKDCIILNKQFYDIEFGNVIIKNIIPTSENCINCVIESETIETEYSIQRRESLEKEILKMKENEDKIRSLEKEIYNLKSMSVIELSKLKSMSLLEFIIWKYWS